MNKVIVALFLLAVAAFLGLYGMFYALAMFLDHLRYF